MQNDPSDEKIRAGSPSRRPWRRVLLLAASFLAGAVVFSLAEPLMFRSRPPTREDVLLDQAPRALYEYQTKEGHVARGPCFWLFMSLLDELSRYPAHHVSERQLLDYAGTPDEIGIGFNDNRYAIYKYDRDGQKDWAVIVEIKDDELRSFLYSPMALWSTDTAAPKGLPPSSKAETPSQGTAHAQE